MGLAYDNVDLNDNYNGRNIVLRAGDGSFRVFSTSQGCFGGYRSGDNIRVEVDMTEKTATFYKNDQLLCVANGIAGPMRPFVSIGSRDVIITLQSHDSRSLFDVKSHSPSSPMLEIAVRTGLDLVFALLEKEENSRIRYLHHLMTKTHSLSGCMYASVNLAFVFFKRAVQAFSHVGLPLDLSLAWMCAGCACSRLPC